MVLRFGFLLPLAAITLAARQHARFEFEQEGSPVAKIIQMLGEMKAKVETDIETETKEMEEFMQFCDDESKTKEYALKDGERLLADLGATIANSAAIISEAEDEITTLGTEISTKERELDGAVKIREAEHADFKTTEADLAKSVDSIGRAIAAVKQGKAFLQGKRARISQKKYREMAEAVQKVVDSAILTGHQKRSLKAFIQTGDKDDNSLSLKALLKQPQGGAYASKTGGILDLLEETKDKAEAELSSCRKAEMEASHEFNLLKQSLENELATKKERLSTATSDKATAEQASGEAGSKKIETEKSKAANTDYLNTLKQDCQSKAVEWEERLKSAKGEIEAIAKATQILQDGAKAALVQVSSRVRRSSAAMRVKLHTLRDPFRVDDDGDQSEDDDDERDDWEERVRAKMVKKLKALAAGHRSFALNQLVSRVKADPMAKIKGLIEEMIAKLTAEAAADASKKAFCDEEMGKSSKAQKDKTTKKDKYHARLDQAEATKVKLLAQISEAEAEMAEVDNAQAEATKIRNAENAEFKKAQADYQSSEEACAQAVEVLRQYYTGAAFIQVRATTTLRSSSKLRLHSPDAGNAIIQFLEYAQQDFAKLLADVEMSENESQTSFDKMTTENKVAKATLLAEAKGAQSEVARLSDSIEDYSDDLSSTTKELEAVTMYLEKLKPECEAAPISAADKMAARKAEIEGLKEALSILEGP